MAGIDRLLVANRGEIARRIIRAAHAGGIAAVAVFADDDRGSPHVAEADLGVPLGAGPPGSTYLDLDSIMAAAIASGADAIHPGYGFLSEDPRLAEACAARGIRWVGPPPAAMVAMADKAAAKRTVAAAGVPVLEGRPVPPDPEGLAAAGEEVGYPLLVKASAGGGGRGMRLVESPSDLVAAVAAARREAEASFGSGEVFLERYVVSPRHVEVQVLADQHGNVVHLFDRECSVQRRHQKVLEEAPAVLVGPPARAAMWRSAVEAARAVGYQGAGTVEFVVDRAGNPYFLEMNTRLQVEHGVTELVTGLDLVRLQLAVAAGKPLGFTQDGVVARGHAVEVRLCAENPSESHRPVPGRVIHARWPSGEGVRVDAGVETGSVVSAAYDSLVAKVMAWGTDRSEAIARLRAALGRPLELDGLETNRHLLAEVLSEPDFLAGRLSTDYLDAHPGVLVADVPSPASRRHAAGAALFLEHERASSSVVPGAPPGWRNVGPSVHLEQLRPIGGGEGSRVEVSILRRPGQVAVEVSGPGGAAGTLGKSLCARVANEPGRNGSGIVELEVDRLLHRLGVRVYPDLIAISSADGQSTFIRSVASDGHEEGAAAAAGECRAPLPGSVVRVLVTEGDDVEEGAGLVVMEAMKMEHTLRAPAGGTVREVLVDAGRQVDLGDLMVVVDTVVVE